MAGTHFTVPRRVEGWVDQDKNQDFAVKDKDKDQDLSRKDEDKDFGLKKQTSKFNTNTNTTNLLLLIILSLLRQMTGRRLQCKDILSGRWVDTHGPTQFGFYILPFFPFIFFLNHVCCLAAK